MRPPQRGADGISASATLPCESLVRIKKHGFGAESVGGLERPRAPRPNLLYPLLLHHHSLILTEHTGSGQLVALTRERERISKNQVIEKSEPRRKMIELRVSKMPTRAAAREHTRETLEKKTVKHQTSEPDQRL